MTEPKPIGPSYALNVEPDGSLTLTTGSGIFLDRVDPLTALTIAGAIVNAVAVSNLKRAGLIPEPRKVDGGPVQLDLMTEAGKAAEVTAPKDHPTR